MPWKGKYQKFEPSKFFFKKKSDQIREDVLLFATLSYIILHIKLTAWKPIYDNNFYMIFCLGYKNTVLILPSDLNSLEEQEDNAVVLVEKRA